MNGTFNPIYSSNSIFRDEDDTRCLTLDLEDIESDIATLETSKADTSHTHTGYAAENHTHVGYAAADHTHTGYAAADHAHTGYAAAADVTALQNLVGDTSVSSQINTAIAGKVDAVEGKGLSTNDYTTAEKNKLAGIPEGGASITVDSSLSATSENPVQNKVVKSALDGKANSVHTHSNATTLLSGFMSASDKVKLNGIAAGANNYSLPTATSSVLGGVKTGDNITNSDGTISLTESNVTSALGYTPFGNSTLSMANGGTGSAQVVNAPKNAILKKANDGNYVWYTQTKSGAFYATATDGVPKFGVLPKALGGTGADFSNIPANAIIRNSGSGGSDLYYFATGDGACYATSANGYPTFGTLPVAQGGTGETTAWTNGTVTSLNNTTITSYQFAVFPYLNKAFIRLNVLLGSALSVDGGRYIAMPSTVSTAHTGLSCFNTGGYDIHCGIASDSGIYVINCGTASMPSNVRLYIAGWYSI